MLSPPLVSMKEELIIEAMGKPQIAVRMPPSLMAKLNSYVEKIGTSKTEVVVSAIAKYLDCSEDVPWSQRVAEIERRVAELEAKEKEKAN